MAISRLELQEGTEQTNGDALLYEMWTEIAYAFSLRTTDAQGKAPRAGNPGLLDGTDLRGTADPRTLWKTNGGERLSVAVETG